MTRRTLGQSELSVFPVCLGGNPFGWTADEAQSVTVLDAYADGGGNFIDTADAYSAWKPGNSGGESETIIGSWMLSRGNRRDMIIATKVAKLKTRPGLSAANIHAAAEDSLRRLQTDYIDLYYAHEDDANTPITETAEAFDSLVRAGKVRTIGLSNYTPERVREFVAVASEHGWATPVAVQPHYNLVFRREFESGMAQACTDLNIGVAPYFSLASGLLTGKYDSAAQVEGAVRAPRMGLYAGEQTWSVVSAVREIASAEKVSPATVALAWLRDRPGVTAPIASARVADQVPALLAAATFALTNDDIHRLNDLSDGL